MIHPYRCYTREDALCQTNGYFSLNLTKKSAENLLAFLKLKDNQSVLWVGCGDARELFVVAQQHPNIRFMACDINIHAINIACRVLTRLELTNVTLVHQDVMEFETQYDIIYSTALAGPIFYAHLSGLVNSRMFLFREMIKYLDKLKFPQQELDILHASLSGSKERRCIVEIQKIVDKENLT